MRQPAIASAPCNAVLTQRSSVNMWLLTHHHTHPARTLDMPCRPTPQVAGGYAPVRGQRSARASESRRRNWIVDLQRLPEVHPRCALWVGITSYSGKAAVRSTGHAWAARSRGQPMFNSSKCIRCWLPILLRTFGAFYSMVDSASPHSLPRLLWPSYSGSVLHLTSCELVILQAATR